MNLGRGGPLEDTHTSRVVRVAFRIRRKAKVFGGLTGDFRPHSIHNQTVRKLEHNATNATRTQTVLGGTAPEKKHVSDLSAPNAQGESFAHLCLLARPLGAKSETRRSRDALSCFALSEDRQNQEVLFVFRRCWDLTATVRRKIVRTSAEQRKFACNLFRF